MSTLNGRVGTAHHVAGVPRESTGGQCPPYRIAKRPVCSGRLSVPGAGVVGIAPARFRRAALFFDVPRPLPVDVTRPPAMRRVAPGRPTTPRLPDLRCRFDAFFAFDDLDLPFFVGMLFLSHVFTFFTFLDS